MKTLPENVASWATNFPQATEAAEAIFQALSLLGQKHTSSDVKYFSGKVLTFAARDAWGFAYLLTAAGYSDVGFALLRRAIEYACYAFKTVGDAKRTADWINQVKDLEAQRRFKGAFKIPGAYAADKYRSLRPLLLVYGDLSDCGVHGNFEFICQKINFEKDFKRFSWIIPEKPDPQKVAYMVLHGHWLVNALAEATATCREDEGGWKNLVKYVEEKKQIVRGVCAEVQKKRVLSDEEMWAKIDSDFNEMLSKEQKQESIRLSDEVAKWVAEEANAQGLSVSTMVDRLLAEIMTAGK